MNYGKFTAIKMVLSNMGKSLELKIRLLVQSQHKEKDQEKLDTNVRKCYQWVKKSWITLFFLHYTFLCSYCIY